MMAFASCGNDDKENNLPDEPTVDDVEKLPYSSLTPEQQKDKLAQEANAFIAQMNDLSKEKSVEVFKSFNGCLSISNPFFEEKDDTAIYEPDPVVGPTSVQARNVKIRSAEDIMYINSFYGKYSWNAATQAWDTSASSAALVLEFPVGKSTTNNGKIEVTGVSSEQVFDGVELPKQLTAKVYYGSDVVASIEVNGDVKVQNNDPAVPATASVTLQMGSYKLTQSFNKADKKATASFVKGATTLISATANVSGNIDKALQESDGNLITGGNLSMELMGSLAIVGAIDVAQYNKEFVEETDSPSPSEGTEGQIPNGDVCKQNVETYNKYHELYLVSTTDKTKIARLIQKAKLFTDEYSYYDYQSDKYISHTYYYWGTVEVLKFNDNTEVEAEVYFSEGFDAVVKNFENFITSLQ